MSWWEIVGVIFGSSVLVKILDMIADRIKRKDAKEDRRDDVSAQITKLQQEYSDGINKVNDRVDGLESAVNKVSENTEIVMRSEKAFAYDRIRHCGMVYIKSGTITADELKTFVEMYEVYKLLGEDTFLDRVMDEVNKLRIKSD